MTPPNDDERCIYTSPRGFRCRNKRNDSSTSVCYHHMRHTMAYAAAREIVSNKDRLDTAEGVHALLARTTLALADGKVQPRRATALTYMCQALLASVGQLRNERDRIFARSKEDAHREKALQDSQHDNLVCDNHDLTSEIEDELVKRTASSNGKQKK